MDLKERKGGKRYSIQKVIKKSLGSYTNIRQNRLKKKNVARDKGHFRKIKDQVIQKIYLLKSHMHLIMVLQNT